MNTQLASYEPAQGAGYAYPALVVGDKPTVVLVDVQTASTMNQQRRKRPTLMPEFAGKDSQGRAKVFRFLDANGQLMTPRLPMPIDISSQWGRDLLLTVRAYKLFYDPTIVIHNPMEIAAAEMVSDDLMLDAMLKLKELRQAGDLETLINLLRRLEGPVGSKTEDMVVAALLRIAKKSPQSILDLVDDPRFQQKVMIDKALEAKRLILRDRYYYYPDNVFGGKLIAEGEEKLLFEIAHNVDLSAYILQSADLLGSRGLIDPLTQPPTPALTAEQLAELRAFDTIGDVVVNTGQESQEDVEEMEAMNEQQVRDLVKKAIVTNYLETVNGKVKVSDGSFRKPEDAEAYFVINTRAAEAMRTEMQMQGLL